MLFGSEMHSAFLTRAATIYKKNLVLFLPFSRDKGHVTRVKGSIVPFYTTEVSFSCLLGPHAVVTWIKGGVGLRLADAVTKDNESMVGNRNEHALLDALQHA